MNLNLTRRRARRTLAERMSAGSSLRVLHVIGTLNRGGAEVFLLNLVRSSMSLPFEIHILCYGDLSFDLEGDFEALGARVHRIQNGSSVLEQYKAIRKISPDIVHAHTDLNAGISLLASRINLVGLTVAHSHTTIFRKESLSRWRKFYEHAMFVVIRSFADVRLACGDDAGRAMFGERSFIVQQNGVDIEQFRFNQNNRNKLRTKFIPRGASGEPLLLGVVARLEPVKNHAFILRVLKRLLAEFPSTQLVLVGRGTCESSLRGLARNLGVDEAVHFLGVRDDVSELLSAFDVVALPSLHEGFPVSMIEAQINGVPVVVSNKVDPDTLLNVNSFRLPIQGEGAEDAWVDTVGGIALQLTGRVAPSPLALTFDAQNLGTQIATKYHYSLVGNLHV